MGRAGSAPRRNKLIITQEKPSFVLMGFVLMSKQGKRGSPSISRMNNQEHLF